MRDVALLVACAAVVVIGVRSAPAGRTKVVMTASASAAPPPAPLPSAAAARPAAVTTELEDTECSFADPGTGDSIKASAKPFVVWARMAAIRPDGSYDLLLHSHGGEAARRVLGQGLPMVLATLDLGPLSGDYRGTFPDRRSFDRAIAAIDKTVSDVVGRPAKADKIVISSFSAGYGAVAEALAAVGQDGAPSGVILLDSLHASYRTGFEIEPTTLEPFLVYARRALEGRGYLALSHSAIRPPGYASTEEVATFLLHTLAVEATPLEKPSGTGLTLTRLAREKGFSVRGYTGQDKGAHCAHLELLPELLEGWRTERGR
ncbi:MAG: hypothetical protein HOV80_13870 [Polyangiaceae bacterium]|nr:hypothetical protein [Polyangiaceae bacterium]